MNKPLLSVLKGQTQTVPPIWLMRQAGRYLPEYRELRAKSKGFLDMVYNPDMASEVTLQPIRRFGMDGAILFSDILVVPHALGQAVRFDEGHGPVLDSVRSIEDLKKLGQDDFQRVAAPVYETVRQVRAKLRGEGFDHTTLIGFSGAPWTLACYMVEGGGSKDFTETKLWAYRDPNGFSDLIDLLSDAVVTYLCGQIDAGAEAVQVFESWAGILDETMFNRWVVRPTQQIVAAVKARYPDIPVIGFPRGAGRLALDYAQNTGITAISLDPQTSPKWAATAYQKLMPVQGNMDPVALLAGGMAMQTAVEDILAHLGQGPLIFNLGHGVIKETPVRHVEQLVEMVRS